MADRPVKFTASVCGGCDQTKDYAMALDRGTALIMMAFANAVRRLDRNRIHVTDEMIGAAARGDDFFRQIEQGFMTLSMQHNIAKPRYHGLLAFAGRGSGEYILTRKGAEFLKGGKVPRVAIIDKVHGKNAGYWEPGGEVTILQLLRSRGEFWDWDMTTVEHTAEHTNLTESLL